MVYWRFRSSKLHLFSDKTYFIITRKVFTAYICLYLFNFGTFCFMFNNKQLPFSFIRLVRITRLEKRHLRKQHCRLKSVVTITVTWSCHQPYTKAISYDKPPPGIPLARAQCDKRCVKKRESQGLDASSLPNGLAALPHSRYFRRFPCCVPCN